MNLHFLEKVSVCRTEVQALSLSLTRRPVSLQHSTVSAKRLLCLTDMNLQDVFFKSFAKLKKKVIKLITF